MPIRQRLVDPWFLSRISWVILVMLLSIVFSSSKTRSISITHRERVVRARIKAGGTFDTVFGGGYHDPVALLAEDLVGAGINALTAPRAQLVCYERPHSRNHK